jgi:DNA-binding beta-propeller fold protein YncE
MPRAHLARVLWSCTAGTLLVLAIQPVGASKATGSIAAPGSILWAKTYDGPAHDRDSIGSLGVSPDGTKVFVTGGSIDVPGLPNDDYTTIAYDASTGARLWLQRYDGPGLSDISGSLGVSPDGTKVFVTGSSEATDFGFSDYATVAYDASTGAMLWVARYDGPLGLQDVANNLGVSPDGTKVFVTGSSTGQPSGCEFIGAGKRPTGPPVQDLPCFDYATIAYDAVTGASLWVKRFDGPKSLNDEARALGVSPDGTKVFVSGASESVQQNDDFATVAYSAATGNQLWVKRYGSAGPGEDAPT